MLIARLEWLTASGHSPVITGHNEVAGPQLRVCPARIEFALRYLLRDIRATRCVVLGVYSNRTSGATHKTVSDRARFRI